MEIVEWILQNWFDLFSAVGIIGSLWIAIITLREDAKAKIALAKAQRIANLLTITANYNNIQKEFFHRPKLARVNNPTVDVSKNPVTPVEESFINLVISHTSSMYEALKDELVTKQDGLRRDIKEFFSLPLPKAVWHKTKLLQNQDFAAYIESSLK